MSVDMVTNKTSLGYWQGSLQSGGVLQLALNTTWVSQ